MKVSNVVKFERREPPPPPPDDFDTASALEKCREMLGCLANASLALPIQEACCLMLLVNLSDLAAKAKAEGRRLTFSEDVDITEDINDVTDLISKLRNAACHVRSKSRNIGESAFYFNRFFGYFPKIIEKQGVFYGCDFADDVAVYYGQYRFYLKRHASRAVEELSRIFAGVRQRQ